MTIFDLLFPLGIGTNRFPASGVSDLPAIEKAAGLMVQALEAGASYVDVAPTYSKGTAAEVCRLAFQHTKAPKNVTIKSSFLSDTTQDDAMRRVEQSFLALGINHASYFVCWNISSWEQFLAITQKGGLYDGAVQAKNQGLIDHICFSTHAAPNEIIHMLKTGMFEGVTLSLSPLNSQIMAPVLDCALAQNVGVVVMNPLSGGLIPQKEAYFSFLRHPGDHSTVEAALRFVYAHPAVKIVLSGMSSSKELQENLKAFREKNPESDEERLKRVQSHFANIEGFCTGCRYCDGCPQEINIFELMQAYNMRLFPTSNVAYGRTDPELVADIAVCSRLKNNFSFMPKTVQNPCIACGLCQSRCTAHLPIVNRIHSMYEMFQKRCFSEAGMLERLQELIGSSRRVAFYPGGGYTAYVLSLLQEAIPGKNLELFLFDGNPNIWGSIVAGVEVRDPSQLQTIRPDLVVISNYNYSQEIYDQLQPLREIGIRVEKLHEDADVPWVF